MAKHNQKWLDARWKQNERQKVAEKKRRSWEEKNGNDVGKNRLPI